MSILNRLRLNHHLDDAALAAIWTDGSIAGGALPHPHLQVCAACRARFAAFSEWLGDLRQEAGTEADAAFPPERLAAQHAQIFRRLEAAGRPARVIAFPKFARPLSTGTSQVGRWVASSAAAGLIVGLGLGQLMDLRHVSRGAANTPTPTTQRSDAPAWADRRPGHGLQTSNDAAFMAEIDASLTRQPVAELRAIDEFTPRTPFEDRPR